MGRGWFDFRSAPQKERDYREFTERVFEGGLPHKRQVRERLEQVLKQKDVTYEFVYYTALKDLLIRKPKMTADEGIAQVCGEIRVLKLDAAKKEALKQVLAEDFAGKLGSAGEQ